MNRFLRRGQHRRNSDRLAEARENPAYAKQLKERMERQWKEVPCRSYHRPARWNDQKYVDRVHDGHLDIGDE